MLALLCLVQGGITSGDDDYTNDAMSGIGPIENSGSYSGVLVAAIVRDDLIPLRDQDFVSCMRGVYRIELLTRLSMC